MTEAREQAAWITAEGTGRLPLARLQLFERVSTPGHGSARLAEGQRWPELEPPVLATVHLGRREGVEQRRIPVLVRAVLRSHDADEIELVDPTLPLQLRTSPRRFRDATARDIVDAVLALVELRAEWRLADEPPKWPYVVQSGETDLAFVTRLLALIGAHYFIDDRGVLVVNDNAPDAPIDDEPLHLITSAEALQRAAGVFELYRGARVAAGRVTVADYDWKRPKLALLATADGARDYDLERYSWPAGFRDPDEGELLARKRLEAVRAFADYAEGRSTVAALGPGRRFALANQDEWFVVEVEHRFDADAGYDNRFLATPPQAKYRPPVETAPSVGGLESVMARGPAGEDIYTDAHGRFKAEMPWDADAQQTDEGARWVRLLQECSTSQFLARSGWEMLCAYLDGDPSRPVGVARSMHAGMPPSYTPAGFQGAMTVRTRSSPQGGGGGSELCVSDAHGGQRIEVVAQRDVETHVRHDQSVRIGRDATEKVGDARTLAVRGDRTVTIAGNMSRHVHGDAQEAIGGSLTRRVGASESIGIKKAHQETIGGSDEERVSSLRITIDGGVGSPADIVKNIVAMPREAVAGVLAAAGGAMTAGITQVAQTATAPIQAARGLAGTAAVPRGLEEALAVPTTIGSLPGQIDQLKNAVTGLTQLPGMVGGLQLPSPSAAFDAARRQLGDTLRGALPSIVGGVASAIAVGEIAKKSKGRYSRRVGGAFVSVSVGDITEKALLSHAEMVGGVRLKLTPKTVATSVMGPLTVLVGGTQLRASRSISMQSLHASYTAGAALRIKCEGPLTIRGDQILLRSKGKIRMAVGDTAFSMTTSTLAIEGDLSTEAPTVEVKGDKVNLTKG